MRRYNTLFGDDPMFLLRAIEDHTHIHIHTHTHIQTYERKVAYDVPMSLKSLYKPYLRKSLSDLSQSFLHGVSKNAIKE